MAGFDELWLRTIANPQDKTTPVYIMAMKSGLPDIQQGWGSVQNEILSNGRRPIYDVVHKVPHKARTR